MSELDRLDRTVSEKIGQLIRISADTDDIKPLLDELRALRDRRKANPAPKEIRAVKESYSRLAKRVDDFEEMFLKYNVPRLCDSESLEAYTEAAAAFMKVWRDEAKNNREIKGEKSLIEWIRQLDEKRIATFDEMRLALVDLGIHISSHLFSYFMFLAVTANKRGLKTKVGQIKTAIECLNVEENSIVVGTFAKVLTYFEAELDNEFEDRGGVASSSSGGGVAWFESGESDWIRLIMKEVLRFEVAFCCPDLGMMLIDEVLLGMANHLKKVIEKKLEKAESMMKKKVEEIEKSVQVGEYEEQLADFKESIESGLVSIWRELDLNFVPK